MFRGLKKKRDLEIEIQCIKESNITIDNAKSDLSTLYAYEDLKEKILNTEIDYLKLHELQMEIGRLGETFVYEHEHNYLKGTIYAEMIDERKALNPKNGYDILSFTREGEPVHIEVKATTGTEIEFYISNHEYKTAKRMKEEGLTYLIYVVTSVMSESPEIVKIKDINSNKEYRFEEYNWKVKKRNQKNC
ncbi:DUF3883 domain-containing protein [Cytobacillus oceanisediminis]|uniref:DUF3883 domain-containing protein n=1 Tax=Cytobacillus oceanisediminis TaxID=665099 RepID=UPI0015E83B04|nr:DUF3883 domain-containing protein [Cytobacillus oceanisediminis]